MLAANPPTPSSAHLVRNASGAVDLVEGRWRRRVASGLLGAALAEQFGEPRPAEPAELATLDEGPPVALLVGRSGEPVVVVDGRRMEVRGVPRARPADDATRDLPVGEVLDIAAANVGRRALDGITTRPRSLRSRVRRQLGRVRRRWAARS